MDTVIKIERLVDDKPIVFVYKVRFKHYRMFEGSEEPLEVQKERKNALPKGGHTVCSIVLCGEEDIVVALGRCSCSIKDNFVKEAGRSISFARALRINYENPSLGYVSDLSNKEKAEFLKQYINVCNIKEKGHIKVLYDMVFNTKARY